MATDRNLYDILGVSRDADTARIREAYRERARRHHPDMSGGAGADPRAMSEINRAWNVLSDPVKRHEYDRSLGERGAGTAARRDDRTGTIATPPPLPPARVPWRFLAVMAAVGVLVVIVADATSTPPTPSKPDQLLQSGSCVVFDERSEAVEVSCSDPHDGVVRQLIAFDRTCPFDTEPHRDRQGMGLACVDTSAAVPAGDGVQDGGGSG